MRRLAWVIVSMLAAAGAMGADELPLPAVPAEMTVPADRAGYILLHFWDAMDFDDADRSLDRDFMGQNMANFLSVFPHARESDRRAAVRTLVAKAAGNAAAAEMLESVVGDYLFDRRSPQCDDGYYCVFLQEMLAAGFPGRERMAEMLEMASKNLPGSVAADFEYIDRGDGRRRRLSDLRGREVLLMFYDPECGDCARAVGELDSVAGQLRMLAVYAGGDRRRWDSGKGKIPQGWTDGFDTGAVERDELYVVGALPVMYLLDAEGRVVLKEPAVATVLSRYSNGLR